MHALDPRDFPALTLLRDGLHAGTEIMAAVLSGHTRGRIFTPTPRDRGTAFVYDNGFCVLAGAVPDAVFARSCMDWLRHQAGQDFFILYPGHAGWEPVIEQGITMAAVQKRQRVGFSFDPVRFAAAQRTAPRLPPGYLLVPMDAALLRQLGDGPYPFAAGMWASAALFEREGVGFCVLQGGQVASLCYSVFVNGLRHDADICTLDGHLRQGLARAVATAFIGGCLQRGLTPGWDCFRHNQASYDLARSLGFAPAHEFSVYTRE